MIPDLSRPPPGFNTSQPPIQIPPLMPEHHVTLPPIIEESKPTAPYYELPAGLMVPLIRLEDCSYKQLDPEEIRLPTPAPPSDRLISAMEAFYAPPSHERPRDGYSFDSITEYWTIFQFVLIIQMLAALANPLGGISYDQLPVFHSCFFFLHLHIYCLSCLST